ncbi:hypothetical protein [Pontibacter sp. SGAir0037]|uniref:hypothetical protein n=1 Tax=Pontibacter sp. SGAir0037 TaxID=2571030 RepID=UPI0010CCB14B|nr:hypothetical protein [Pontibacter sp. SGAir0037]QCR22841.1 hypothetical protein C1N53_11130 [Pontibacter sp. SGAir0037]
MANNDKVNDNADNVKSVNDDYHKRVGMNNNPDPSAKRNIGPNGETERRGQKDKLENMHIGGNEATGYGANTQENIEASAQGPGFEFEGSDTAMDDDVNGVRSSQQGFGEDEAKRDNADHSRR